MTVNYPPRRRVRAVLSRKSTCAVDKIFFVLRSINMWVRAELTATVQVTGMRPSAVIAVFKSLFLFILFVIITRNHPSVCAKPFTFQLPAGFSLGRFAGTARAEERVHPPVKPYTGKRVSNDSLLMVYWHDQAVAVAELGPEKLLLNCEIIEVYNDEDRKKLLKELSAINRPLQITFPQILKLMTQCQQVEGIEPSDISSRWADAEVAKVEANGPRTGHLGGNPLSLLQGIIPGTKWCGTGDIAANYHDLGADRRVDRCCRTHDLCSVKVRGYSKRYNLTNNSLYTKSHCKCDDVLFDCLKATNTSASQFMGNIYFNLVQVPCVDDSSNGRIFRNTRLGF